MCLPQNKNNVIEEIQSSPLIELVEEEEVAFEEEEELKFSQADMDAALEKKDTEIELLKAQLTKYGVPLPPLPHANEGISSAVQHGTPPMKAALVGSNDPVLYQQGPDFVEGINEEEFEPSQFGDLASGDNLMAAKSRYWKAKEDANEDENEGDI